MRRYFSERQKPLWFDLRNNKLCCPGGLDHSVDNLSPHINKLADHLSCGDDTCAGNPYHLSCCFNNCSGCLNNFKRQLKDGASARRENKQYNVKEIICSQNPFPSVSAPQNGSLALKPYFQNAAAERVLWPLLSARQNEP